MKEDLFNLGDNDKTQEKEDVLKRSEKMAENVDKFANGQDLDNSIVIESNGNKLMFDAPDKEDICAESAIIEEIPSQESSAMMSRSFLRSAP